MHLSENAAWSSAAGCNALMASHDISISQRDVLAGMTAVCQIWFYQIDAGRLGSVQLFISPSEPGRFGF